ncbi:MAG: FHA domain-containing protein, partial [Anaerolineaceae bacterium]|nr:FHA domain-containing protein [Anaerolineaceae bacterium]
MLSGVVVQYCQSGESWNEITLEDGEIIVGRGQDCGLQIDHEGVSRKRLKISKSGDAVWVTDLGSTNGTRLDGVRIQANVKVPLRTGQLIE